MKNRLVPREERVRCEISIPGRFSKRSGRRDKGNARLVGSLGCWIAEAGFIFWFAGSGVWTARKKKNG
ncbi:hypothetical protein KY290_022132 [Solanum tuberosum]|uniref:Uncharacterized protein n=1 Tax=Solanum tuberosum TaxID=4113 RepID=A0ABQ7V3I3_SOLTU|nr:hypothetical protein KY289_021260 [Solanum tuberosum]KAH0758639.1 hypothetical protein KY290_022132 [Solanum tuberosum]